MKHSKEDLLAVLALLLTLAVGAGIQMALQVSAVRQAERQAGQIMEAALSDIREISAASLRSSEEAAERMAALPEKKQARLENLHLDLLTVVSAAKPLKEGYVPELATVVEEYQLDARCSARCWEMMQACRDEGAGYPMICSAYRTQEYQEMLYTNKVIRLMEEEWVPYEDALVLAAEAVAVPGTSEHQLGLAADIMDETYPYLNEWQENTGTQIWLMKHSPEYGFILRYPAGTSDITGIMYEPWHYRYVGEKFAAEITKRGITLEEYVAWRRGR